MKCLEIPAVRQYDVGQLQPVNAEVFSYYEPGASGFCAETKSIYLSSFSRFGKGFSSLCSRWTGRRARVRFVQVPRLVRVQRMRWLHLYETVSRQANRRSWSCFRQHFVLCLRSLLPLLGLISKTKGRLLATRFLAKMWCASYLNVSEALSAYLSADIVI